MTITDFSREIVTNGQHLKPLAISLTQNHEAAQDLYQETMMKALLNREKYRPGTNQKAWLYTIMRNIFINNYRKNKKYSKVQGDMSSEYFASKCDMIASNEGYTNLRVGEIKKAIERLPKSLRLSFELYYSGYKYEEIAEKLQEPLGTIKSRIHFARKTLATQIER